MSLAIVLKSALTFLRHRNPELARSPGLLSPRVALCSPCSRTRKFTVEVRKRPGLVRKTPTKKKAQIKFETKPKREGRRGRRRGMAEAGRAARFWAPSSFFFLKDEQWLQKCKLSAQRSTCGWWRASEVGRENAISCPPFPAKDSSNKRLAHSKTFFPKKKKN